MFYPDSQEDQICRLERRLQEELDAFNQLSIQIDEYLSKVGITKEQVGQLLQDPSQFSPSEWTKIGELKEEMEAKLHLSTKPISDPRKAIQARSQIKDVQRHWLPVR